MTQLGLYIVSDVHGYIFPTDFSHANQQLPMGLLYANQLIETSSKHDDIHFKIDNGDFLQGAPFCNYLVSKLQTSEPLTTIYNRLNFDFGTIGNHEFNYGLTYLNDTLQTLNYPVLCANILDSQHQPFTGEGVHCVNNYRAVGGGNYNMFANAPVVKDIQEEGAQLLIDFITNNDLSNIPQVVNFKVKQ